MLSSFTNGKRVAGLIQKTRRSLLVWLSRHLAPLQPVSWVQLCLRGNECEKKMDERVIKRGIIVSATLKIFIVFCFVFYF